MPLRTNTAGIATIRRSQILEDTVQTAVTSLLANTNVISNEVVIEVPIARVITTSNITLNDEQVFDGVSIVDGDMVLVNGQTSDSDNGLYLCVNDANWQRVTSIQPTSGLPIVIREGTANKDTLWIESKEFAVYNEGVTELKWVKVGDGVTYTVSDTDTIDMVMTGTVISANLRYQDSLSVDLSDDAGGLKADVRLATPTVGGTITAETGGLRFNHKLTAGRGINLFNNLPTTGDLQVVNNVASGVGVRVLEDTPSAGVLTVTHDINGTEGITVTDNSPSTGDLNIKVTDGGITTAKLADDAVTNAKLADDSVGANELLLVNSDGYISFYSGAGTPTEQGIDFAASKVTHNWKRETINTGILTTTTHTLRMPPTAGDYYPQGVYHVDIYAAISVFNAFNQSLNNTAAPTLAVSINGGAAREIDKGLTHEDLVGGSHKMLNNSLQGSLIVDLTSATMSERYFEIIFTLNINATANKSNATGYCDVFELKPAGTITYET